MSDFAHRLLERTAHLRAFGYNEREADFLCLAAVHSGYFLRRQYCEFLGCKIGGTAASLIEKALAFQHVKASVWANNTKLYHLYARPLYAGLGQSDNRHRRERQPFAVKNKLMGLDFVLAHREFIYLATETDKVAYFTRTLGIDPSKLPARMYQARRTKANTTRYFVDKQPIYLTPRAPLASPVVSFCYIDEGMLSPSRFETYLAQYGALFSSLGTFELVYVATADRLFESARRAFQRLIARLENGSVAPMDPLIRRLLDYFELRFCYENKELRAFDRAKLIQLRDEREAFSGTRYDALFEQWKKTGQCAVLEAFSVPAGNRRRPQAAFSTYLLEERYGFLGSLVGGRRHERQTSTPRQLGCSKLSAPLSEPLSEART